jgi:hypothetical protein
MRIFKLILILTLFISIFECGYIKIFNKGNIDFYYGHTEFTFDGEYMIMAQYYNSTDKKAVIYKRIAGAYSQLI